MDSLPEERRWRAFPRFPLIDDGLTGGSDHARESRLTDVETSAQRFELNVIVLGNGGPGQWHWRGGRAALSAVVCAGQRVAQEGSSPSGALMESTVSKSGGNASLAVACWLRGGGQGVHREVESEGYEEQYRAVIEGAIP